jgi:hypothetical protein
VLLGQPARVEEALDEPAGGAGRDDGVTGDHGPDSRDQVGGERVLEQEAAGAGAQPGVHVLVEVEGGQHKHPRWLLLGADAAGRLDPVEVGHPHVHQHHVRVQFRGAGHCLVPVACLTDYVEAAGVLQDGAQPGAHQHLVVGEQDPDHAGSASHCAG